MEIFQSKFVQLAILGLFLIFSAVLAYKVYQIAAHWKNNNVAPIITERAQVVSKRSEDTQSVQENDDEKNSVSTNYFVTFKNEKGETRELNVEGLQYSFLEEGDNGKLVTQGTRYLKFAQNIA